MFNLNENNKFVMSYNPTDLRKGVRIVVRVMLGSFEMLTSEARERSSIIIKAQEQEKYLEAN